MGNITKAAENRPAELTPQQAIKRSLDTYRPVFTKLLAGTGVSEATFAAQIANACRTTPALFRCKPETVLGAALRCAQLGLAPNDVRNLAWIIPYGQEAQFQIGYGGIMELARRAVPGLRFDGRPVYPNDEFDVDYGKRNRSCTGPPSRAAWTVAATPTHGMCGRSTLTVRSRSTSLTGRASSTTASSRR
jgi:recombinase, phage RecT family